MNPYRLITACTQVCPRKQGEDQLDYCHRIFLLADWTIKQSKLIQEKGLEKVGSDRIIDKVLERYSILCRNLA
jgi:hypothetical protein